MKKTSKIHAALFAAITTAFVAAATLVSCSNSSDGVVPILPSFDGTGTENGGSGTGNGGGQGGGQQQETQTKYFSKTLTMGDEDSLESITGEYVGAYEFVTGSDVVKIDNKSGGGNFGWLTTLKPGTATIKFTGYMDGLTYVVTITVEAGGGQSSESLELQFLGTWKFTGSNTDGTITLNANKKGHLICHAGGSVSHNTDFDWSVRVSGGKTWLKLYNLSNSNDAQSPVNGNQEISSLTVACFVIKTANGFGFGMPASTKWIKQ